MAGRFLNMFRSPTLTPGRVRMAYGVAIVTDLLQMLLGPFGWVFGDQFLDVIAMALTWRLLGFHPLLLPTVILEFVPIADMLPSWTGCVALVVTIRKRQHAGMPPPPEQEGGRIIDI